MQFYHTNLYYIVKNKILKDCFCFLGVAPRYGIYFLVQVLLYCFYLIIVYLIIFILGPIYIITFLATYLKFIKIDPLLLQISSFLII